MDNIIEKLSIDQDALDVEWLDQPKVFFEISAELADSKKKLERIKLAVDVTVAELAKNIRENPEQFGISKVTESAIKEAIATSPEQNQAMKRIIAQKHEVEILQAGVSSFDQRKRALENLVTLHGQQYFASPKEPKNVDTTSFEDSKKKRTRTRRKREE